MIKAMLLSVLLFAFSVAGCAGEGGGPPKSSPARAAATSFEDGQAAEQRGDHAAALKVFQPLADQGDRRAYLELAHMHEEGLGVPQDDVEAIKWYILGASYEYVEVMAEAYPLSTRISQTFHRMTSAQREEAKRRAAAWKPKSL